jgi:diguanylate cyclase
MTALAKSNAPSLLHRLGTATAVLQGKLEFNVPVNSPTSDDPWANRVETVLDFLRSVGLDPTPDYYYFAWEYCFGSNRAFQAAIDAHCKVKNWIDPHEVDQLSATHLSHISAIRLAKMLSASDELLGEGHQVIRQNHRDQCGYSDALHQYVHQSDNNLINTEQTKALLSLTKDMAIKASKAQARLEAAGQQVAEMRQKLARATNRAETDQLTGLPNRWWFEKHLKGALQRCRENVEPLCVAFVDVDHFKRINDSFGHETGDRVLRRIAKTLSQINCAQCHVARHGGEEFAILFEAIDEKSACASLDQVRVELSERSFTNRETGEPIGQVTFSAGISSLSGDGDARAMLRRADTALYRAKQSGRNQIIIA